jgi:hypothetical protein
MPTKKTDQPLLRIEHLLTQLLLTVQHQGIEIARLQDELDALRQSNRDDSARVEGKVVAAGQRADWLGVQIGDVLRVLLRELREVRTTQVFAALNDGPINAQLLADLIEQIPDELTLDFSQPPAKRR